MNQLNEIALVGLEPNDFGPCLGNFSCYHNQEELIDELKIRSEKRSRWPSLIVSRAGIDTPAYDQLIGFLEGVDHSPAVVVLDHKYNKDRCKLARELGALDYLTSPINTDDLLFRIKTLLNSKRKDCSFNKALTRYQLSPAKRLFDIVVSASLLLALSPLFLLVAALIRLESPGKVFYYQPRVGSGYKVFKFFKFRSMRVNADKMVGKLKDQNQYANENRSIISESQGEQLFGDDGWIEEEAHQQKLIKNAENAFFKVKDDPRITRVGKFIRNTSIDELPQLFNVLIGDMSIVGNRPLPLYEAEKLTTDDWAKRFLAPAGITGLWQVTERGKSNASADSRKRLDIQYAQQHTFWGDLKILLKTPLAALQHENV